VDFFEHLIHIIPLELFVFIGTVIDEIISPIPAFIVLIPAGVAAHLQEFPFWYLAILGIISAVARMLAGYVLYLLADKFEDILFARGRKFFGTSHADMEGFGKKLSTRKPIQSWLALFTMHALPVFPGVLLSLGSGFIRLRVDIFLTSTLAGSFFSALFFLILGYTGTQTATLLGQLDQTTQIFTIIVLVTLATWGLVIYIKKRRPSK
jgi:membrane protein DedA with SNARE-associated domain